MLHQSCVPNVACRRLDSRNIIYDALCASGKRKMNLQRALAIECRQCKRKAQISSSRHTAETRCKLVICPAPLLPMTPNGQQLDVKDNCSQRLTFAVRLPHSVENRSVEPPPAAPLSSSATSRGITAATAHDKSFSSTSRTEST